MRKPKLFVVTDTFPVVSQTFVLREVRAVQEMGWDVHVIANQPGNAEGMIQGRTFGVDAIPVTYLDWWTCPLFTFRKAWWSAPVARAADRQTFGRILSLRRRSYFSKLLSIINFRRPALIHAHWTVNASQLAIHLSELFAIPFTVTAHDSWLPDIAAHTLKKVQEHAAAIACVSNGYRMVWVQKTGSNDKIHIIPNGVDLAEFLSPPKRDANVPPVLLGVSNIVEHKRPEDLIRAAKMLRDCGHDCRLVLVGSGPHEAVVRKVIWELRMQDRVQLIGAQPHTRVREEMAKADIFVHASDHESFGIVLTEAMASRLPVVASNTHGASDIIEEGVTGYLFQVGQIGQLAEKVHRLLEDPGLRIRMGKAGRRRVEERFSWSLHMEQMVQMWTRSLNAGKGNANLIPSTRMPR